MDKRIFIILSCLCFIDSAIADVCDEYKKDQEITLKKADWDVVIKPSDKDLWPRGGFITVQPFSSFSPKIGYVFNGKYYCVFLDSMDAEVGFHDFKITIDKKYAQDSCEYNAVLEHEKHHMTDSENAFNNIFPKIKDALQNAVNSVKPIYVENADDVPYAFEKIQNQIMGYKQLKDLVEEFKQQQEQDANHLDGAPDEHLQKCEQDKIDAAFEKYFKKKAQKD